MNEPNHTASLNQSKNFHFISFSKPQSIDKKTSAFSIHQYLIFVLSPHRFQMLAGRSEPSRFARRWHTSISFLVIPSFTVLLTLITKSCTSSCPESAIPVNSNKLAVVCILVLINRYIFKFHNAVFQLFIPQLKIFNYL